MFYDRFVELCGQKNISRTKACIDCGVSRTAWHKWESGATPNGTTINKFAAYFEVSVGYLLGKEEKELPTDEIILTEEERRVLLALREKGGIENLAKLLGIADN